MFNRQSSPARQSKESKHNLSKLLDKFEQFDLKVKKIETDKWLSCGDNGEPPYYNFTRTELGKEIYLLTKNYLDENKDILSPLDKGEILKKYIKLWFNTKCILDIKNTEYAEEYKKSRFNKYGNLYNDRAPMVAGFNLEKATLGKVHAPFLIFLSSNLKEADFSDSMLAYSHFENCNLAKIKTSNTNFNQCRFKKCNLQEADLQGAGLCEVSFTTCNIDTAPFKKNRNIWFSECLNNSSDQKTVASSALKI